MFLCPFPSLYDRRPPLLVSGFRFLGGGDENDRFRKSVICQVVTRVIGPVTSSVIDIATSQSC